MSLFIKKGVVGMTTGMVIFLAAAAGATEESYSTFEWESDDLQDELRFLRAELMTIETASGTEETLRDAPAAMVVITAEEIKQRGYTDLTEVIMDLPGFDVTLLNGSTYMIAYQRGYRTPFTQRTLFMINGIVENQLWGHTAHLSRQYPLSNIKKIEVLYGPASAVYGPNAFLGVVNIITYDGTEVKEGETDVVVNVLAGSYQSRGLDATIKGKPSQKLSFSLSGKLFKSDEPDLTGQFGFLKPEQFSDPKIWGPLLEFEHQGHSLGSYYDPTDDYGILADLRYEDLKLGVIHWKKKEAEGPAYAADRVQNNAFWNQDGDQYFIEYDKQITGQVKSHSLLLYRDNRSYGYWIEAEPDNREGREEYSSISFTQWNSISNSWLFKQDFEWAFRKNILFSSGLKFERKRLTKAYDIPGYWESAVSSSAESGSGIKQSSDSTYTLPPPPGEMPADNLARTRDIGGYLLGIFDLNDQLRLNLGMRYDRNSMYGGVFNPRFSAIYKMSRPWTFKLLYGEAFQEPSPMQLWGGWSGRAANPELQPEKARNLELIAMHQMKRWSHEISLYYGHYKNVIKEEAENAGERDIYGFEYRAKSFFPNFISDSPDITSYFNYTFNDVTSSVYYNHNSGAWEEGEADLGDIAPHKFNIGLNMPIGPRWNFNLRGHFVGERELYLRNPLRWQGEKLNSYFTLDSVVSYRQKPFEVFFKVLNILDENYFHPGSESAGSGNDFTQRSLGYHNSLVPQPGRSFWVNLGIAF